MEAGQAIRAENLRMVDWPAAVPLTGGFNSPQSRWWAASCSIRWRRANRFLTGNCLRPGAGGGITVKIPDGMRAISLRTDEIVGVAGFLLPGTHVDVLVTLHMANVPIR